MLRVAFRSGSSLHLGEAVGIPFAAQIRGGFKSHDTFGAGARERSARSSVRTRPLSTLAVVNVSDSAFREPARLDQLEPHQACFRETGSPLPRITGWMRNR